MSWYTLRAEREVRVIDGGAERVDSAEAVSLSELAAAPASERGGHPLSSQSSRSKGAENPTTPPIAAVAAKSIGKRELLVRVLDGAGSPIPQASVRLRTKAGGSRDAGVKDGRATFRVKVGEETTLDVWDAKERSGVPLNLAPARRELVGDESEIEVVLAPGLSIEGIVHGPSGAGLLEVLMIAQAKSKGPRESAHDPVGRAPHLSRPDASGAFQCVGLAEGDYELSVDRAPAEFEPYESSVVRAGTTGVDVVLRVGLSALVTVLDATGAPLDVTMVEVETTAIDREGRDPRLPGHFYRSYFTDSTGIARVIGLRAGVAYSLRVEAPGHFVFDRAPWTPADTTIRLDRAYTVTGVVKDPDGAPVPHASVYWSAPGARQQWRWVEADGLGLFYLDQIGAGGVDLVATLGLASSTGPGGAEGEPMHVAAGAEDVTLTLDFGQELTVKIENWPCGAPGRLATLDRERAVGPVGNSDTPLVSLDGVVRFRGLRVGTTYRLRVGPLPSGLSCLERGLRAGREVRVRLTPGKSITGRVIAPSGIDRVQVSASGDGFTVPGTIDADGRFMIHGLPEGAYVVAASAATDAGRWFGQGEASAGGSIDLELKRAP